MKNSYLNQIKRFLFHLVLSIFYLIPLYHILNETDKFLFSWGYLIYFILFSSFSILINFMTTKKISKFQLEGEYQNKQRFFSIGKKLCIKMGVISFLIIYLFSKPLANFIIENLALNIERKELAGVLQISSLTALFLPLKNFYLGYLEGHKKEKEVKYAEWIEEGTKLIGLLFIAKIFPNIKLIILFFPLSAFLSYLYLYYQSLSKKKELEKETLKLEYELISEQKLKQEFIHQFIFYFSFLFFFILVYLIDIWLLIEILPKNFSYSEIELEKILSTISCWSLGLMGEIFSILCIYFLHKNFFNHNSSFAKAKDFKNKMGNIVATYFPLIIPVIFSLIVEMNSIVTIFYDKDPLIIEICIFQFLTMISYFIFQFSNLFWDSNKKIMRNLTVSIGIKIILTIPFMTAMKSLGLQAYSGASMATIFGYGVGIFFNFRYLGRKYKINLEEVIQKLFNSLLFSLGMTVLLILIPIQTTNRLILSIYILFLIFVMKWSSPYWEKIIKSKSKIK